MRRLLPWLLPAVWILYTFGPLLSVLIASGIANAHGCALDEGSVHPCLVAGRDLGELLYTMGVMGWLMLITLPTGLLAGLAALIVWVVVRARRRTT